MYRKNRKRRLISFITNYYFYVNMQNIDVTILFEMLTFLQLFRNLNNGHVNKNVTMYYILPLN
jgi:hypothetical protein